MIRLLAEASFNGVLVTEIRRQSPHADLVTANEVGLQKSKDPVVLEWAAANRRVVIASDKKTMIGFAYDRVRKGLVMPGLIFADQQLSPAVVIESLLLIIECGVEEDFENRITYLPI